jgi:hypothetical protein
MSELVLVEFGSFVSCESIHQLSLEIGSRHVRWECAPEASKG